MKKNQIVPIMTSTASMRGIIREMELDELKDLLNTITDEKLIDYINTQISQLSKIENEDLSNRN
jgi:hypothetical protein